MDIDFYGTEARFGMKVLLDAPRELVWQAWSTREAMAKWWGPKGFKIDVTRFEFRPGGMFLYSMNLPNGDKWWGRFVYREIVAPEKIVFANGFSDENGGLTRAPFNQVWPLETLSTVTFTSQGDKTLLVSEGGPVTDRADELKAFEDNRQSMKGGYTGTMEQLVDWLKGAR
jgi:uncharacterized protein YndB with AHSA1/START domain